MATGIIRFTSTGPRVGTMEEGTMEQSIASEIERTLGVIPPGDELFGALDCEVRGEWVRISDEQYYWFQMAAPFLDRLRAIQDGAYDSTRAEWHDRYGEEAAMEAYAGWCRATDTPERQDDPPLGWDA